MSDLLLILVLCVACVAFGATGTVAVYKIQRMGRCWRFGDHREMARAEAVHRQVAAQLLSMAPHVGDPRVPRPPDPLIRDDEHAREVIRFYLLGE